MRLEELKQVCDAATLGLSTAPLIDPRWKSSTALDLARVVRGVHSIHCKFAHPGGGECECPNAPQPIHGILAEALEERGACGPVMDHLREPTHIPGQCWVARELLG